MALPTVSRRAVTTSSSLFVLVAFLTEVMRTGPVEIDLGLELAFPKNMARVAGKRSMGPMIEPDQGHLRLVAPGHFELDRLVRRNCEGISRRGRRSRRRQIGLAEASREHSAQEYGHDDLLLHRLFSECSSREIKVFHSDEQSGSCLGGLWFLFG